MRTAKPRFFRNRLDLNDRGQVRVIRKRLRISEAELAQIVTKSGNSISAISKEVSTQRTEAVTASLPSAEHTVRSEASSDTSATSNDTSAIG
jgi:DNA-binding XRE family transcriptional regulator